MVNNWLTITRPGKPFPPTVCFLCGANTDTGRLFCNSCPRDFARTGKVCPICGKEVVHDGLPCSSCSKRPPGYDCLIAPFHYTYPVSLLIKLLKYNNKIEISRELGKALAGLIVARGRPLPEVVIPVPLHPIRTITRGYNQAGEIAFAVAAQLNLPVDTGLVRRSRHTRPQFNLNPAHRRMNMRGAFKLRPGPGYRTVAIVDDVVTTGATANEVAMLLRRAGMKTIEVWACARTD